MYYESKKITSVADWENKRREELKNLALENVYGFPPPSPEGIQKL